mmetsp:Transcript_12912/g.16759  ORF Transcript_12912/g.16759 Transcript_12912/m.16759 type:complete len:328 (+) Transcript_12912:92-1075(+)
MEGSKSTTRLALAVLVSVGLTVFLCSISFTYMQSNSSFSQTLCVNSGVAVSSAHPITYPNASSSSAEMKLINLGFMKTGTSTLKTFLWQFPELEPDVRHFTCGVVKDYKQMHARTGSPRINGNNCGGYIGEAIKAGLKPLELISGNFFTQNDYTSHHRRVSYNPSVEYLDEMFTAYSPNEVVFTLTTRATPSWVESIKWWYSSLLRLCITFQGREIDGYKLREVNVSDGDYEFKNESVRSDCLLMAAELKDWNEYRIRSKAAVHGHKLVELNLAFAAQMEANYKILAQRLGIRDLSRVKVSHANANKHKERATKANKHKQMKRKSMP